MDLPIRWQAYEYEEREKSSDWFWALGIIALASAVASIIFENLLFALLILIGAFTLALFAARKPRLVNFAIERRGIRIDSTLYPYSTLEAFWISHNDEEDEHTLIIRANRLFMPHIVVPINHELVEPIHETLSQVLDEEEMQEPISEKILDYFGL